MSKRLVLEVPDSTLAAMRSGPEDFANELRLAAAVKWYEMGKLSQAKAAELAGLSRHDFLRALARFEVSPFQETASELAEGLAREK